MSMQKSAPIFVAGHRGLVGSALMRALQNAGYTNLITRTHQELELCDEAAVEEFFASTRPHYVFLAAAKVGGIHANTTYPAEFAYSNMQIQNNVVHSAWKQGVRKLCFLGSSCIYPKYAPQPIAESCLLSGKLEPTNKPYALAKIAGIVMCQSYNRQYGTNFISVMPTNLYGPGDSYHPEDAHVVPALIRRFHEAKLAQAPAVQIWGTGNPLREFLYVDDLADGCIYLMNHYDGTDIVNIGSGIEVCIKDLALTVKEVVGYGGRLEYDSSKPDGTPRKLLDCSKIHTLGWNHTTELAAGVKVAYEDFCCRYERGEFTPVK